MGPFDLHRFVDRFSAVMWAKTRQLSLPYTVGKKHIMATTAQINSLTSLYVGYFDRAPDPAGLQGWINAIDAGVDIKTIAGNFATSAEATALYPYLETPGL